MPGIISDLIHGGIKGIGDAAKSVIDSINAPKEEKDKANLALQQELDRHQEVLLNNASDIEKAYIQDTQNARSRESDVIKSTGHFDYAMWVLAAIAISLLGYLLWTLTNSTVPSENREMLAEMKGTIEMIVVGIFSYYFGSSVGSRIKDMKSK